MSNVIILCFIYQIKKLIQGKGIYSNYDDQITLSKRLYQFLYKFSILAGIWFLKLPFIVISSYLFQSIYRAKYINLMLLIIKLGLLVIFGENLLNKSIYTKISKFSKPIL